MTATIAARAQSSSRLSAPARRPAPARRKAAWLARIARLIGRRPGRVIVLLACTAVAGAILVNALMFQKARHPAPMGSASAPAQPVRQAERPVERKAETPPAVAPFTPVSAPAPPSRPSDLSQTARETQGRPPAGVTSAPRTPAAAAAVAPAPAARTAAARDPIADLINGGDIRPPAEIRGAAAKPAPVRRTVEN